MTGEATSRQTAAAGDPLAELFIFPLSSVLFPDGLLPLRIFEQRYMEMTKVCLRDNRPFGVCRIREGREVGAPAVPESVGCLANIVEWEMPQLGMFHLLTRGSTRFRIEESHVQKDGLIVARATAYPADGPTTVVDPTCAEVLRRIMERVGRDQFPAPPLLTDATWVSHRLAELLPVDQSIKQELLEMTDVAARQQRVRSLLVSEGLIEED